MKFRVKTEQEFIDTLGENWRNRVSAGWDRQMDEYFGAIVETENEPINLNRFTSKAKGFGDWTLSQDMVLPADEEEYQAYVKRRQKIEETKSKITVKEGNNYCHFSVHYAEWFVYKGPTANCQLGSIACFNNLLGVLKTNEEVLIYLRASVEMMKLGKTLFIVDVNQSYTDRVAPLTISGLTPYTSTNGSDMVLGIIKI